MIYIHRKVAEVAKNCFWFKPSFLCGLSVSSAAGGSPYEIIRESGLIFDHFTG
jgi:hypothetical protein